MRNIEHPPVRVYALFRAPPLWSARCRTSSWPPRRPRAPRWRERRGRSPPRSRPDNITSHNVTQQHTTSHNITQQPTTSHNITQHGRDSHRLGGAAALQPAVLQAEHEVGLLAVLQQHGAGSRRTSVTISAADDPSVSQLFSQSQFHVYLLWNQRPFSIVS